MVFENEGISCNLFLLASADFLFYSSFKLETDKFGPKYYTQYGKCLLLLFHFVIIKYA